MSEAISGLANVINPIAKVAQPLMQGFGVVSNILQGNRNAQVQQQALNRNNQLNTLINNPAMLSARIKALQQPLSQSLTQDIGNEVQGYLGERGLSISPNISASVLGQALAPYELQQEQMAQNLALEPFQLANGTTGVTPLMPTSDTSGFWSRFAPNPPAFPGMSPTDISATHGGPGQVPITTPNTTGSIPSVEEPQLPDWSPGDTGYQPYTDFPGSDSLNFAYGG